MGAYEFLAEIPPLPGDLDADGLVGGGDLDIVRANWGRAVPAGSLYDGDPSGDGMVGGEDLDIVRANWGQSVPTAAGMEAPDDTSSAEPLIGPRRESVRERVRNRDAFFANTRALADAAWTEAIEALSARRQNRQTAVDAAFLAWGRR